jgi:ADP-ribose pyrophosphatase YjhB (NUDIX family)
MEKKIKIPRPKVRQEWGRDPVTKVKSSEKLYRRGELKKIDWDAEVEPGEWEAAAGQFVFCPWCSSELVARRLDGRMRLVCPVPACGFVYYRNPVPAVGAIIVQDGKLLMVKRKFEPQAGKWSLPAGFMEYEETPTACVRREVKEETGFTIEIDRLFNVYPAQDDPRSQVVLIIYLARIISGRLKPGDDATRAEFFAPENMPEDIAFSAHRKAIAEYFQST